LDETNLKQQLFKLIRFGNSYRNRTKRGFGQLPLGTIQRLNCANFTLLVLGGERS